MKKSVRAVSVRDRPQMPNPTSSCLLLGYLVVGSTSNAYIIYECALKNSDTIFQKFFGVRLRKEGRRGWGGKRMGPSALEVFQTSFPI